MYLADNADTRQSLRACTSQAIIFRNAVPGQAAGPPPAPSRETGKGGQSSRGLATKKMENGSRGKGSLRKRTICMLWRMVWASQRQSKPL